MGAIVFGEIAQRDVLAVPGVVRKTERFLVQHFDEALRAAAVLDIGRAGGGHGREERGIELGDERRKIRGHAIGKARRDALFVGARGTTLGLRMAGRRREDDVGVVDHGTIRRARARPRRGRRVAPWRGFSPTLKWIISLLMIILLHWNRLLQYM